MKQLNRFELKNTSEAVVLINYNRTHLKFSLSQTLNKENEIESLIRKLNELTRRLSERLKLVP